MVPIPAFEELFDDDRKGLDLIYLEKSPKLPLYSSKSAIDVLLTTAGMKVLMSFSPIN